METVIQQCIALSVLLGMDELAMFDRLDCRQGTEIPSLDRLHRKPLEGGSMVFPDGIFFMFWWAVAHSHQPVLDLWRSRYGVRCCTPEAASFLRHVAAGRVEAV